MFVAAAAFLLFASPDPQTTPPAATQAPVAKPKKICRHDMETGSMMPKRVCHTPEEWQAEDAAHARDADNLRQLQGTRTRNN